MKNTKKIKVNVNEMMRFLDFFKQYMPEKFERIIKNETTAETFEEDEEEIIEFYYQDGGWGALYNIKEKPYCQYYYDDNKGEWIYADISYM